MNQRFKFPTDSNSLPDFTQKRSHLLPWKTHHIILRLYSFEFLKTDDFDWVRKPAYPLIERGTSRHYLFWNINYDGGKAIMPILDQVDDVPKEM